MDAVADAQTQIPYAALGRLEQAIDVAALAPPHRRGRAMAEVDAELVALRRIYTTLPDGQQRLLAQLVAPLRDRHRSLRGEAPAAPGEIIRAQQALAGFLGEEERLVGEGMPLDAALSRLGITALRPGQQEAIDAALAGRDALVVMATGSGKSLCYQAPALCCPGMTVVVSPLISLMTDQVERLERAGADVVMLASTQSAEEAGGALARIARGEAKVVFCAPERFTQSSFLSAVGRNRIDLFVVDEAHTVVEWGDDFRPEYMRLAEWRDGLGARATMALTATATPTTAGQIMRRLQLSDPLALRTGFDRANITFDVFPFEGTGSKSRKREALLAGLADPDMRPAIVYCSTRKDTEHVAEHLQDAGIAARAYHAGIGGPAREAAQRDFMQGAVEVMCATNAFGMGVDARVRSVWHWAIPKSLEAYYQEAGRAGRDGAPARAVLLAMKGDLGTIRGFIDREGGSVEDINTTLRLIADKADADGHFGLDLMQLDDTTRRSVATAARVGAIELHPAQSGQLLGTIRERRLTPEAAYAARQQLDAAKERRWQAYHAIKDYAFGATCRRQTLLEYFGDPTRGTLTTRCCDVCDPVVLERAAPPPADLLEVLRRWRDAAAEGRRPETICSDATLRAIVAARPADRAALGAVRGVGPLLLDLHADALCAAIASFDGPAIAPTRAARPRGGAARARGVTPGASSDDLLGTLKAWRKQRAQGRPAYTVCKDATLAAVVERRPANRAALADIPGVGPAFLDRHAADLLRLLADQGAIPAAAAA